MHTAGIDPFVNQLPLNTAQHTTRQHLVKAAIGGQARVVREELARLRAQAAEPASAADLDLVRRYADVHARAIDLSAAATAAATAAAGAAPGGGAAAAQRRLAAQAKQAETEERRLADAVVERAASARTARPARLLRFRAIEALDLLAYHRHEREERDRQRTQANLRRRAARAI